MTSRPRRGLLGLAGRSLTARLVGSFLVLSLVIVASLGVIAYLTARGSLEESVYERLAGVADSRADNLDRWIDEQGRSVVFIGQLPGVGAASRTLLLDTGAAADRTAAHDELAGTLQRAVSFAQDAEEFLLLDLDGVVRVATQPEHEGASQAGVPYFEDGQGHVTVQPLHVSNLTGTRTITVAAPVFDHDGTGRRVGVLAANLRLDRIDRIVRQGTELTDTATAYLVGSDRRIVHEALDVGAARNGVSSAGIDRALGGESGQAVYLDYQGTPVIGVYRWLPEHDVALVAEMDQDEAFGAANQLALVIGLVGSASAALLAVGVYLLSRRIARPIVALASTASRVSAGHLDATAPVTSRDEVGQLATAFNDMTAQLRENVETLEQRVEDRTAEIRRQKQYFESLVDISPVAVVTTDREERITGWNPAAATLFGFSPEDAVGRSIDELVFGDESAREEGRAVTAEALARGIAHRVSRRQRRDGRAIDVEIVMVPLVIDGEHTGFYVLYHDVTELEAARRDADAANQAKSAFLAAMSHEIRTPMNAVIGMSGLLLETPLAVDQRDFASTIRDSGEALLTIINDILDFSKIEAGRFELEFRPLVLADVVKGAVDVIGPTAQRKGLAVRASVAPDLPPAIVGDAGRLRQILLNLLSNAVKFTDQGEVALTVAGERAGGDGRWTIRAAVRDTGMGIPPDRIGRLFQSFSQADASIARRFGGTGLGLAISRRLAELMGGTLAAESSGVPGAGSTFTLTIPAEAAELPVSAPVTAVPPDATPGGAEVRPLRILLAEDNAVNVKLALRLLERMGYGADVAGDGSGAVEALERSDYDVVLMDVLMPGLDGLDATRAIRARWPDRALHIVAMTANAMEGDRETCLAAGMDDYVSKPVRPEELARALAGVPARGAPGPSAERAPA